MKNLINYLAVVVKNDIMFLVQYSNVNKGNKVYCKSTRIKIKNTRGEKMNFLECFKVRDSEKIKESYMVEDNRITVNISKKI